MRRGLVAGAAAALGVVAVVCAGGAGTSWPAEDDRSELAFVRAGRIWTMRADGSESRLLVPGPRGTSDGQPAFSPDGRELAFARSFPVGRLDDRSQIYVARADGTGAHAVTPAQRVETFEPAWSPDGRRLAFNRFAARGEDYVNAIVVIDRDGGNERVVTQRGRGYVFVSSPSWSPDGRHILFTRTTLDKRSYFGPSLYVLDVAGGAQRLLAREALGGDWSPDGTRIAFSSVLERNGERCGSDECSYAGEIAVMRADGGGRTRLTRNLGDDQSPAWSADGRRITFESDRNYPAGEHPEVYTVAADGGCLTWLTNRSVDSGEPAWRPGTGSTDPGACGAAGRPPVVDTDARPLRSVRGARVYWLGPSWRNLLLSVAEGGPRRAFVVYDDCGSFDPRRCPPTVQLQESHVCVRHNSLFSADSLVGSLLTQAVRFRAIRSALFGDLVENDQVLYAGATEVRLFIGARHGATRVARDLQPVRGRRSRRLPRPVLPRRLVRRTLRTAALYRRLRSVRETARRLHVVRHTVRDRVRIARAFRRVRVRTVRCPRR